MTVRKVKCPHGIPVMECDEHRPVFESMTSNTKQSQLQTDIDELWSILNGGGGVATGREAIRESYLKKYVKRSSGFDDEIIQIVTALINSEVSAVLDELEKEWITVIPETYPTSSRKSMEAVPLSAITNLRERYTK